MIEINLLPPKNVESRRQVEIQSKGFLIAASVTAVVGVVFLILLGTNWFFGGQVKKAETAKAKLLSQLAGKESEVLDIQLVKQRVLGITEIRKAAVDFKGPVSEVFRLAEGRMEVNKLTVTGEQKVSTSLVAKSAENTIEILKTLGTGEADSLANRVLTGLRLEGENYTVEISGKYKGAASGEPTE